MNEKLKEIIKQAGVFYSYQDQVWELTNGDLEKFAELIVQECVAAAEEAQADFYVINNIKTRFGVEP